MMKKTAVFILISFFALKSYSQDIDLFQKKQNDNFKFEKINPQMSIDEYRILSRNLRMKEMLYAMIVPGYVHFYAKDNLSGYSLLAIRSAAFGTIAYLAYKGELTFGKDKLWKLNLKNEDISNTDKYLAYTSMAAIFGTYFYDWIHGNYMLKKKQENIRYKYNMKLNLGMINSPTGNSVPSLNFQIKF